MVVTKPHGLPDGLPLSGGYCSYQVYSCLLDAPGDEVGRENANTGTIIIKENSVSGVLESRTAESVSGVGGLVIMER